MNALQKTILKQLQFEFPLHVTPFKILAHKAGIDEQAYISEVEKLQKAGIIRYIKPILNTHKIGYKSLLIGCSIKQDVLETIISYINKHPHVTHNYQRNDRLNVWFTFIYKEDIEKENLINNLKSYTGMDEILIFPSEKTYKLGLQLDV